MVGEEETAWEEIEEMTGYPETTWILSAFQLVEFFEEFPALWLGWCSD